MNSGLSRAFLLPSDFVGTTFIRLFRVRLSKLWILSSFLCSPFNCALALSIDRLMNQFSSNLPPPLRSRFSRGRGAVSGGQPLVSFSSVVVPALVAVMTPSSDGVGSLAPIPSYDHNVDEDVVLSAESLEPAPLMDNEKQPSKEGF